MVGGREGFICHISPPRYFSGHFYPPESFLPRGRHSTFSRRPNKYFFRISMIALPAIPARRYRNGGGGDTRRARVRLFPHSGVIIILLFWAPGSGNNNNITFGIIKPAGRRRRRRRRRRCERARAHLHRVERLTGCHPEFSGLVVASQSVRSPRAGFCLFRPFSQ